MRKKREFIESAAYHVTSRTNDIKRVFECKVSKKTMLLVLRDAKEKFKFRLPNFCIMPTHIHLLIVPAAQRRERNGVLARYIASQPGFGIQGFDCCYI